MKSVVGEDVVIICFNQDFGCDISDDLLFVDMLFCVGYGVMVIIFFIQYWFFRKYNFLYIGYEKNFVCVFEKNCENYCDFESF